MEVSIEEGFLNHIGAHSGEAIKASLLAASSAGGLTSAGLDNLDNKSQSYWEKEAKIDENEQKEVEKKVYCKQCGNSKFTLEQLEKSKKLYKARFNKLQEKMTLMYDRRLAENKEHLMGLFNNELARFMDTQSLNKN